MELSLQLYGYLILTFLGIITPFLIILLSIFQEGVSKLTSQYENEKSNSEENLKAQIQKQSERKHTNVKEIKQSIKELETISKKAKKKLSYLNPKKQTLKIFIYFLVSFLGVILEILNNINIFGLPVFIVISLIFFAFALHVLWKELCVIIEVRKIIDRDKNEFDMKTLELLSSIVKKDEDYFLKNVFPEINGIEIRDDSKEITLNYANIKHSIELVLNNSDTRMAKNIEFGIVFPKSFLVEKSPNYSTFIDTNGDKIIRYNSDSIHGRTNRILSPLEITPMEEGEFIIKTFIKAENIEVKNRPVKFIIAAEIHDPV